MYLTQVLRRSACNDPAARPWRDLLALALWLLATIALRPLLLPDEGRYAGVAFEMLHGGALVPTLDGLPFFHKPPLLYWIDVGAMRLFGVNQFAVRIGPALMAWLLGAGLFLHLRHWYGLLVARTALVVLATSPLFFVGGQYVNHDMGVAACITVAVLAIVRAVEDPLRTNLRWLLLGWAFCGLGVLAKGLIGVVLPALVVGPWLLGRGRWRQLIGLLHPLGLLVFAAVVAPWLLAMQARYPGFFDYFIVEQHFRRYTGASFNNARPFWFFVAALPMAMLPWSLWLWPALRQRGERAGLYLWWVASIVLFFSLPTSKLIGYVMPALAPLAALLAVTLVARASPWRAVAAGAAAICVVAVVALGWQMQDSHRDIGRALAERWRSGDRLVYINDGFYDLRFYAGVAEPAIVLSAWDDPEVPKRDNWRKELLDATRFATDHGRSVLWPWARLGEAACHDGRVWMVATPADQGRYLKALPGLETVLQGGDAALLLADRRACGAVGTPP